MKKYLVFLEQRDGIVKNTSLELWHKLQELAAPHHNIVVCGILVGGVNLQQLAAELFGKGVIYHAGDERLMLYNSAYYAQIVAELFQREAFQALFFADTILSRELAPKLSVLLHASLLSGTPIFDGAGVDCGSVRPVYSASAAVSFQPERSTRIYTVTSFLKSENTLSTRHIEFKALEPHCFFDVDNSFPFIRRVVMLEGVQDLTEAAIIVGGGRGVGSPEGFVLLEQLALLLGGVPGASRAVVDEGWRPHSEQIGQTGRMVTPLLYFACGISGSVQHLAGIGSATTIVAINSDPHAPIFDSADFGIIGDVSLVLPKLIAALQDFLKKK